MLKDDLRRAQNKLYGGLEWIRLQRRTHFTREAAIETALWMIGAALLFPASCARLLGGLAPFAPALFSAGLAAGLSPASMLLGCAAAIPIGPFSPASLAPMMSCLVCLGASIVVRLVFDQQPQDPSGRDIRMTAIAAVGALLPALIMAQGLMYNLLSACASAIVAAAAAPTVYPALMLRRDRQRLLPDERLALFACAAVAMLGCCTLPWLFGRLSLIIGFLVLLFFSCTGAGSGALGGVGVGLVLRACGAETLFCAAMPLCGALAGALSVISRPASAGGLIVGAALAAAWQFGFEQILPECACALLVGCSYSFLPERLLLLAKSPSSGERESELRALQRQRTDLKRKTDALADVLGDLSAGYARRERSLPSEAEMVSHLRDRLCAGCPSYASCWAEGGASAGRLLCQLLGMAFSGALIGEESELPPELGRQCRRAGQIPRRVGPILADYDARRRAELKRTSLTSLMSAQFRQVQDLLRQAGEQIERGPKPDPELTAIAKAALEKEGVHAEYVYAIGGDEPEICARLAHRPQDGSALRRAAALIGEETGEPYQAALSDSLGLRISPVPRFRLNMGVRSVPGRPDCPNGDSRSALRLADGRVLLALSDGMGSGERAGRESAETLRLIARFLQAGIEPCGAIDAINELMLLRSGEDMFSTVDLCLIDAGGASAEFIKLGACRSYLLRGGACVRLEGGRLPLGILEEVRPVRRSVPLCRGDLIVMATDGLESGDEDEWIVEILYSLCEEPPQKIADALVREAMQRPRAHIDDTTVLAVRVA